MKTTTFGGKLSTVLAKNFRLHSAHRHLGDLRRSTFVVRVLQLPSGEKDNRNRAVFDFLRKSDFEDKLPSLWIIDKLQTVTRQQTDGVAIIILENNARSLRLGEQSWWRESLPRRCTLSDATNKIKRVRCRNKQRNPRISAFADEIIIVTLPLWQSPRSKRRRRRRLGLGVEHLGRCQCHHVAPYQWASLRDPPTVLRC